MSLPGAGEILVRIAAATTCGTDVKVFRLGGHPRMLKVPTPFGHELAGTVAASGSGVEEWQIGDRIVVVNSASCGRCSYCLQERENLCSDLQYLNGAFAEYLLVPERFVESSTYAIPDSLPDPLAALAEPLACVFHGIEACGLDSLSKILVVGAGPIGQLFVGTLASAGHRLVVVDSNASRREVAIKMGATQAWDRSQVAGRGDFDLAIDATGTLAGWERAIQTARAGGQVLFHGGCPPGSRLELDTSRVHYDELTLRGAYHHRPPTVRQALDTLTHGLFPAELLLTAHMPLAETEEALRSMMRRDNLKVVLDP